MTTPDPKQGAGVPVPGELGLVSSQLPRQGDTPALPSFTSSTPGVALAGARVPGAPTLPDADPVALTRLLGDLANELFRTPPVVPSSTELSTTGGEAHLPSAPAVGLEPPSNVTPTVAPAAPATVLPGGHAAVPAVEPPAVAPPALAPIAPSAPPAMTTVLPAGSVVAGPPPVHGAPVSSPTAPHLPTVAPPSLARPDVATRPPEEVPSTSRSPFDQPLDFSALAMPVDASVLADLPLGLLDAEPAHPPAPPAPVAPSAPVAPTVAHGFEIVPTRDPAIRALGNAPFDPHVLRREFPILDEPVRGKRLVWLDNAATTQKPRAVIDRLSYFYEHENSNIHRAAHTLAARATDAYEAARESTRRFLGAPSARDIVFVRGTTEGINLIAQSWGRRNIGAGDEIVITWLEHHANIVPWQQLCEQTGARLKVAPVDDRGQVLLDAYERLLGPRTKLVAFTQVSNALGTVTPAKQMIEMAHRHGAIVLLDGAQAVSHMPVDVQALGCDFFVFSGHKVFGPTGIGAVYGRSELLDAMPPWQGGGNMIADVTFERTVYQPPPARFEAGTGNIADAVGLGAALDWLMRIGVAQVGRYEHELLEYGTSLLCEVPGLTLIGTAPDKAGVLSFVLDGQNTTEVGGLLDQEGIAVRSGHHCAQPILRRFGLEATVRASLAPYNTFEDLDALAAALHRLQAGRVPR